MQVQINKVNQEKEVNWLKYKTSIRIQSLEAALSEVKKQAVKDYEQNNMMMEDVYSKWLNEDAMLEELQEGVEGVQEGEEGDNRGGGGGGGPITDLKTALV